MALAELLAPALVVALGVLPLWWRQHKHQCRLQRRLAVGRSGPAGRSLRLRPPSPSERVVLLAFAAGCVLGAWFALPWWALPLVGAAAAWGSGRAWRARELSLAREHFARDFPDAVEALLRAIQTGVPVDRALASLSELYPDELGRRFAQLARQLELGVPFRDALQELARGLESPDVDFFCAALALNRDSGGILSSTLQSLARTLRERRAAQRKLSTLTAESRSAARIVAFVPLVVVLVQALTNPQQLQFLWHDESGRIVAVYAFSSIAFGLLVIRRMSRF